LRLVGWVARNGLAAVSVAGVLVYAGLRLSYVAYYDTFGVSPEDVGASHSSVLTEAGPGFLVAVVLPVVLLAGLFVAAIVFLARGGGVAPVKTSTNAVVVAVIGFAAIFLVVALLFVIPWLGRRAANDVQRGREVHASRSLASTRTFWNPLALNARRVDVQWIERDDPPLDLGTRLMLLGSAGDAHYLWDVEKRRTVRVPRALVIVTTTTDRAGSSTSSPS
jgi:hypothetical protein